MEGLILRGKLIEGIEGVDDLGVAALALHH